MGHSVLFVPLTERGHLIPANITQYFDEFRGKGSAGVMIGFRKSQLSAPPLFSANTMVNVSRGLVS